MRRAANGRTARPAGRVSFERLLLAGVWLVAAVALVGLFAKERSWSPFLAPLAVGLACAAVLRFRGLKLSSLVDGLRQRTPLQMVAVGVVGVALVASAARGAGIVRSAYDNLTAPTYSLQQADVEPLSKYALTEALVAAARVIPVGASYTVLPPLHKIPYIFRFWLMPRPFTWSLEGASWVILYQDPTPSGLRYRKRFVLAPDVYALEVGT